MGDDNLTSIHLASSRFVDDTSDVCRTQKWVCNQLSQVLTPRLEGSFTSKDKRARKKGYMPGNVAILSMTYIDDILQ
jgi:hypothetical protein